MFRKRDEIPEERIDVVALAKDKAKLEVEKETLEWKLRDREEKIEALEAQIKELRRLDAAALADKNKELSKKIESLEFSIANNTEQIEIQTENSILKSEKKVMEAENAHLKALLDTYRAMPDVENMIKHLSQLAVPSIKELSAFASQLESSNIIALTEKMDTLDTVLRNVGDAVERANRYMGDPMYWSSTRRR